MTEQREQRVAIRRPFSGAKPFRELWEDMDRFWEGFPRFPNLRPLIAEPAWPAIDVFEKDGWLTVKADVPGMTAKDIEVSMSDWAQASFKDGVLEVRFPLKEEAKQKKIEIKAG